MKYFALLLVLVIAGLAYVRSTQPKVWNQYLDTARDGLRAPEQTPAVPGSGAGATTNDVTNVPPPKKPAEPTYISPEATNYINPDHVHAVDQPAPATTNTP